MHARSFLLLVPIALACVTAEPAVEPATPAESPEPPMPSEPPEPATPAEPAVEPAAQRDSLPPNPAGLTWSLTVKPSSFALSDLERVRIVLTAHNDGDETTQPLEFRPYDLQVDGEPSMALSMAFGNGLTGPKWSSLPAGESTTDERVGVAFVDAAGKHVISAHRGDEELARVTVTVRSR